MGISSRGFILALALLLFPSLAQAWGLLYQPFQTSGSHSLAYRVLKSHQIRYCVSVPPRSPGAPELDATRIATQVEYSIRLWLRQAGELSPEIQILRKSCQDSQRPDLEADLAPVPGDSSPGAFCELAQDRLGLRKWARIRLNTAYVYFPGGDLKAALRWKDFGDFADSSRGETLQDLLETVSLRSPMDVAEFAKDRGSVEAQVFYSTYHVILHEIGHAFGLCDTDPGRYEAQCDPAHRSALPQLDSVMKTTRFLYLTGDDILGVRAVFSHIRASLR